jgi:hypothetical protein
MKQVKTANSNVELVQSFEDAFVTGDMDYILSILDDDVTVHECDSVPYPGTFRGKDGFLEVGTQMASVWDITSDLDCDIVPAGHDRVLNLVAFDAIARATGKPIRIKIAEIFTVKDNKISDIQVYYWDTKAMADALAS